MNIRSKIIVTGARMFKGDVDGTEHDFTKINYIPIDNYLKNDREVGYFPTEILAGTSLVFDELSKYNYPCIFDAELSLSVNRKGKTDILLNGFKHIKDLTL